MAAISDRETATIRARGYDLRVVALGIAYQAEAIDGAKYSESADNSSIIINPQSNDSRLDLDQDRSTKVRRLRGELYEIDWSPGIHPRLFGTQDAVKDLGRRLQRCERVRSLIGQSQ